MALSKVVSLRIYPNEMQYFEERQLKGESIAVTIKRLALGESFQKPEQSIPDQELIDQLKEEIKTEILEAVAGLLEPLRDGLLDTREKTERLANTINDMVESLADTNSVNTVNTVNNHQESNAFEGMNKAQLQKILNESGIRYRANASKTELVKLCLTQNFGKGY